MNGKFDVLGQSFGGDVTTVLADNLHDFFVQNREHTPFTKSGEAAYLKSMGIPVAFFLDQPIPTQDALLVRQQQKLREKSKNLLMLTRENKISFAAPESPMGWQDPSAVMGLTKEEGFDVTEKYRYTFRVEGRGYSPTVFVTVPTFYSKPIVISIGLFKAAGTHGYSLVDRENTNTINIRPKDFNRKNFLSLITGIREILLDMKPMYESFTDYLRARKVTLDMAQGLYDEVFEAWKFPKTLVDKVRSHVDLLKQGKDVDPTSPPNIENAYDATDVLTYYASRLPSATSQEKAEAGAFHYFYNQAKLAGAVKEDKTGRKIRTLVEAKLPEKPKVTAAAAALGLTEGDKPTVPVADIL